MTEREVFVRRLSHVLESSTNPKFQYNGILTAREDQQLLVSFIVRYPDITADIYIHFTDRQCRACTVRELANHHLCANGLAAIHQLLDQAVIFVQQL